MLELYSYGWILLPIGLFFSQKKYRLDTNESLLILIANLTLAALIFNNWLTQILVLILNGCSCLVVLNLAKSTHEMYKQNYENRSNHFLHFFIRLPIEELFLPVLMLSFWCILRVATAEIPNEETMSDEIAVLNSKLSFTDLMSELKGLNCTKP